MVDLLLNGERPDLGDFTIQYCHPHTPATYVRGPGRRRRWEIAIGDLPDAEALAPKHIWQRLSRWLTPAEAEQFRSRVGCLSDDVTGYRSVMLVNCALLARMDGRALVEEKGIHVWHPDDLDGSADYLLELGAGAVAVRPDRYVCGAANDAAALDTLVRALPPNRRGYRATNSSASDWVRSSTCTACSVDRLSIDAREHVPEPLSR